MEVEVYSDSVERFERFHTLQAGKYWKAKEQIADQGIDAGEVLLLESIRWVDDVVHTIILRPHPLKYGQTRENRWKGSDGIERWNYVKNEEHRFLVDDFLAKFEYEPDGEAVREQELLKVQGQIKDAEMELRDFSVNPEKVALIVDEGMQKAAEKKAEKDGPKLPALTDAAHAQIAGVATGSLSNALIGGMSEAKIEVMRAAVGREHQIATIKSNWISEQTKKISEIIQKTTPFYSEKAAAALAQTDGVVKYAEKLQKGIASLDLYVGKNVEVMTIREGESAPDGMPLTIAQRKLCVDEELAVYLNVDQWFDFNELPKFYRALRENDALVEQIFPSQRSILVMATTRRFIDYGDGVANAVYNFENKRVFLMVRDGWNIHLVDSPITSHLGASRLFPSLQEADGIFKGWDGRDIGIGDLAFTDRLAAHESQALHYKRFLILMAGLDHRLKLFGNFYDEREALEFISQDFQEKNFVFLRDDEIAGRMIGNPRPPLREWMKEQNSYLQSGSRVIALWGEIMTAETSPACFDSGGYNGKPWRRYVPVDPNTQAIVSQSGNDLFIDTLVHGETTRFKEKRFNAKVNMTLVRKNERYSSSSGYLCLDAVSPEELDFYIHDRNTRVNHLGYMRLFKLALTAVTAERKQEEAMRLMMRQALIEGKVAEEERADAVVNEAVIAWRAANRGKALPKPTGTMPPPQWKALLDIMYHVANGAEDIIEQVEAQIRSEGYEPLRIAVAGDGRIVAYAEPKTDERDDRFQTHIWVHRIVFGANKGKLNEKSRKWTTLLESDASEKTVKQWETATAWIDLKTDFTSLASKVSTLGSIAESVKHFQKLAATMSVEQVDALYEEWLTVFRKETFKKNSVARIALVVPFGLTKLKPRFNGDEQEVTMPCLVIENLHAFIFKRASESTKALVRNAYVSIHNNKTAGAKNFDAAVRDDSDWSIKEYPKVRTAKEGYFLVDIRQEYLSVFVAKGPDPLLNPIIEEHLMKENRITWLADQLIDGEGSLVVDATIGNKRPEGYGPFEVWNTQASRQDTQEAPLIWYDIMVDATAEREDLYKSPVWKEMGLGSMSRSSSQVATIKEAHNFIEVSAREAGRRLVPSEELPELPQPKNGVKRWYAI